MHRAISLTLCCLKTPSSESFTIATLGNEFLYMTFDAYLLYLLMVLREPASCTSILPQLCLTLPSNKDE